MRDFGAGNRYRSNVSSVLACSLQFFQELNFVPSGSDGHLLSSPGSAPQSSSAYRFTTGAARFRVRGALISHTYPFLSFRLRMKLAEIARIAIWPRHLDAPIVRLHE